jgi:hypothetical protein
MFVAVMTACLRQTPLGCIIPAEVGQSLQAVSFL